MTKDGSKSWTVAVLFTARKRLTIGCLGPELDQEISRNDPLRLHTVVAQLTAKKRPVGKGCIDKVSGMLVLLVEIADLGKIATTFQRGAVAE